VTSEFAVQSVFASKLFLLNLKLPNALYNVICGMIKEGDSFVNPPETLDNALGNLRFKRNSLLAKTDWTANSDVTMSDAMKTYRQQLRDAPTGLDTVEKVEAYTFPTEVLK
jgi:hypothetical protein